MAKKTAVQKLRKKKGVAWENLETLCALLDCQPADLIAYEKGEGVAEKAD